MLGVFQKRSRRLPALALPAAVMFAVLALTACQDKANAEAGLPWLEETYKKSPPNKVWKFVGAKVEAPDLISIDVVVPQKDQVAFIRSQSSMKRLIIARRACPRQPNTLGDLIGDGVRLQINLYGEGKKLIDSICPHLS